MWDGNTIFLYKPDNVTAVCRSAIQENIMNSILQARCKIQGLYFISFTAVSIMCTECKLQCPYKLFSQIAQHEIDSFGMKVKFVLATVKLKVN